MPINFEYYETPDPSGEDSKNYHVRTVTFRTVETNEIAKNIQRASSLTIGDIKAVLTSLSQEIATHLGESNRVHLEGIGYFQVTLKANREIDPKKTRAQSIEVKSVKFRADKELKNKLMGVGIIRSGIKRHSASLTNEDIDKKVTDYFEKNEILNRRDLERLCRLTKSTASRHLKRLKDEGKIRNVGLLKQPVYIKGQ